MFGNYAIADFLAYDLDTWQDLFAIVQWQWWPVHLGLVAWFAVGLRFASRAGSDGHWLRWPLLAALVPVWLWVAYAFHWRAHGSLNWAAGYWSLAFAVQALILALLAWQSYRLQSRRGGSHGAGFIRMSGAALLLVAVALFGPAMAGLFIAARPFAGLEWFVSAPDPLAWLTLVLVALPSVAGMPVALRLLTAAGLVIPAVSLALSGLLGHALGAIDIPLVAAAGLLCGVLAPLGLRVMRTVR